ncbi:MAG TPA: hypothetical protein VE032_05945 [Actinomycetota bacterium]|nr:hypothetical protein [Actinomycetota bacterium]
MGAGYTLAEVAERAGVPLARVEALIDAGVIPRRDAYDEGAVRRAMLL